MKKDQIIAIGMSDVHLSLNPPVARSRERDWLGVQAGYLQQVQELQQKHGCPVLIGGDLFHRWDSPAELINFAIKHLPQSCYGIPGQHDLPMHNYDDLKRSAFYTLVAAGKLTLVPTDTAFHRPRLGKLTLFAFPWGHKLHRCSGAVPGTVPVALVHRYCWGSSDTCYPGAKDSQHVMHHSEKLKGVKAVLFGDNHKQFMAHDFGINSLNPGSFMRRNIDEVSHRPAVGLLTLDGRWKLHYLDCTHDKFLKKEEAVVIEEMGESLQLFLQSLGQLGKTNTDFTSHLNQYFDKFEVSKGARRLITRIVEELHHE